MRVGLIFDDRPRPETTGGYCLRALRRLATTTHLRPDALATASAADFDLFVRVDDGLDYPVPDSLRPLAWWAIDTHLDFDRGLAVAAAADLAFAAQRPGAAGFRRAGVAADWLPLACDPAVHRPQPVDVRHDVGFVGNVFPGPRADLLDLLARHFPAHRFGRAYFADLARAYSGCRVAFNRSIRDDLNMRVFEALACGPLLATNALPAEAGQAELFRDGVHLAEYATPDELLDKVRFYLGRPDALSAVARAGREAATADHTYRHRMERVLEAAGRLPRAAPVAVPAPSVSPAAPVSPDAISPAPPAAAGYDPGYFEFDRPELLALVPADARDAVDLGCGAGRLGQALKARQSCRVVGVEADPAAAAAARTRLDLVLEGDLEALDWPFPPHSFDAVVCGDVLEHLRDPLAVLRKVRDWLRPGGALVLSLPNARHHTVVRGLLAGDWTYEPAGLLDRTHLRFVTRREAEKLLFRAGFAVPELVAVPGPGYAAWAAAGRPGEVTVGGLRIGGLAPAEAEEFFAYQWVAAARPDPPPAWGLTSIVILTHDQLPLTRRCLDWLRLVTDEPFELVLVDNGSADGTPEYLQALAAADPRVTVVLNADNRGFPAGCNQGIRAARGDQILLLNNDTVPTTGWLARLLRALHSAPDVGLAGPCSNRVSGEQQVPVEYDEGDLVGLDGFAWRRGRSLDGRAEETDRLVGFCLLVRRAVVDAVGLLDEGFGVGNFEDDDYCVRARRAGFRAVIARDAFVHHVGGATFAAAGVDYAELLRRNGERFRAKWADGGPGTAEPPGGPVPDTVASATPAGGARVSGCLIVRDNAGTIRPCLDSLRPWVDELVVVDTGSADGTPAIAAELGARVFHFEWIDDFSAARNESLRHAAGDWIFWMDSDDTLPVDCGRRLRGLATAAPPDVLGFTVDVHCPGPPGRADEVTVVTHVKLFRRRSDLRFEHRIHEQILPAIARAGGRVAHTDLFVVHSGYDHSPAGQERKLARDLRILHAELAERPGHPFTLFNLGMTSADAGRPADAVDFLDRCVAASGERDSHVRKAFAYLVSAHAALGRDDRAEAACAEGLRRFPLDAELRFRRGLLAHRRGDREGAAAAYRDLLARGEGPHFGSAVAGLRGHLARHNLALVLEEMGDLDGADGQWRAVLAERPDHRAGWRWRGALLVRTGRLTEAGRVADELIGRFPADGWLLRGRVTLANGDVEGARAAWTRAAVEEAGADPADRELVGEAARLLFERCGPAAAVEALAALARLDPADAAARHNLAAARLEAGDPAGAASAARDSLRLRPDSPATRQLLAAATR